MVTIKDERKNKMPKMSDRLSKSISMHGNLSGEMSRPLYELVREVECNREVIKKLISLLPRCLSETRRKRLINELDEID